MKKAILLLTAAVCAMVLGNPGTVQSKWLAGCAAPDNKGTTGTNPGTWTKGTALPTPRSEAGIAVLDGLIYVGGGIDGTHQPSTAFEVYDPVGNTWQKAGALPAGLYQAAMAGAAGHIYLTGGLDASQKAVKTAWAYDMTAKRWAPIADMPAARAGHSLVAFGSELYVMGGQPDSTALWIYDPDANAWDTSHRPMINPRTRLAGAVLGGILYAVGGEWKAHKNSQDEIEDQTALEAFNPATGAWSWLADMPTARGALTAAGLSNRVHVIGGLDSAHQCTIARHEVYDPVTNSWSAEPDLPSPRQGLVSAVVDGQWYVVGGLDGVDASTGTPSGDVDIFTPAETK